MSHMKHYQSHRIANETLMGGGDNNPLSRQEGGDHYKTKAIQPVEFIHKNGLNFLEGSVVKRIARWRDKNGIEDLRKAKHEIDLLIKMEGEHE